MSYATRRLAERAMLRTAKRKPIKREGKLMAYPCSDCGGWHFGHALHRIEQASNSRKRFVAEWIKQ